MVVKKRSKSRKKGRGWFNEPRPHGDAARGISTRGKRQTPAQKQQTKLKKLREKGEITEAKARIQIAKESGRRELAERKLTQAQARAERKQAKKSAAEAKFAKKSAAQMKQLARQEKLIARKEKGLKLSRKEMKEVRVSRKAFKRSMRTQAAARGKPLISPGQPGWKSAADYKSDLDTKSDQFRGIEMTPREERVSAKYERRMKPSKPQEQKLEA